MKSLPPNLRNARFRDRVGNIFTACVAEAPSYSDAELWTLIEGVAIGGKPTKEQRSVSKARKEYDEAVDALVLERVPHVGGVNVRVIGHDPVSKAVDIATQVAQRGTAIHSVINALNVALIGASLSPIRLTRAGVPAMLEAIDQARHGRRAGLQLAAEKLR